MDEGKEEQVQVQQNYSASILNKKKRVMVAIDENETSFHALQWTLDFLFPSATAAAAAAAPPPDHHKEEEEKEEEVGSVILLHVHRPFQHLIIPAVPGPAAAAVYVPSSSVIESVKKAQEKNTAMLLSQASKLCKHTPVKVETMMMEGEPKEMICEAVEQTHPDLLILGSRGLGTLKRAFLGSVSDYCAHHAKCPVLIVKPQK
ncbi:hypothetical protein Scep_003534 [Stephania cephalantha]|uniref:UspA domain-containing protein n=1 Tax=Stephania cephalantha TaxID=152367 RepID=A0AAP0KTA0_9MAGN